MAYSPKHRSALDWADICENKSQTDVAYSVIRGTAPVDALRWQQAWESLLPQTREAWYLLGEQIVLPPQVAPRHVHKKRSESVG